MSDRAALVFEERQYSQAQLEMLTNRMATALAGHGVRAGERVALMASNRPELILAVRALWRLGAAVVMLSPSWKRAEIDHALAITGAHRAVGDQEALGELLPMWHLDEPLPADGGPFPATDPDADSLLVFSSGTTGLPKAVRHTGRSFAAAVGHWRDALGLTASDRIQITTPPSHILGLLNIVTALETGGWVRLHRRFDLELMLRSIERDRITVEMAVAPIALALAAHPTLESYDLSSLRYIMWGATPVTASVAREVTRRTGVGWVPAYGASELPVLTCSPVDGTGRADGAGRLDSVGRAVPGVRLRVVSLETGVPLGPGETGEVQASAASLMAGYLPAEATAAAFDDGWYRTGDVGSLDADGWLRLTDRVREMVKVRGFQVAPAEVEGVLHAHPAVTDCAVFGVPDPADGERLVAAVTTGAPVGAPELIAWVGERLSSYKRPRDIVFAAEIPRLPSGKVLRRVLKERYGRTSDH